MNQKFLILVLLFGALCQGQSTLTTPTPSTSSSRCVANQSSSPDESNPCAAPLSPPSLSIESKDGRGTAEPGAAPRQEAGPRIPRTEFELFVEDATGHPLPTYGRQLFEQAPSTFAPVDHVPVPADYALGPGDELLIRGWGKIDIDARVTVDRNGQIYLPKVGTLRVAGLRYAQLEGFLHAAVGALYRDFELNVTLGQLRSIQIFVLGNARRPGAYTVGSLSTLVDALFVSGGPAANGSMRHIQLLRGNQVLTDFDVYDLVKRGDKSHDMSLLPGDILFIPPLGAQVAIAGSVNEPGIYELKGETSVAAAVKTAGGLTSLAGAKRALLERVDDHSSRRVEEFSLDTTGMQRMLKDGDLLQIFPVSPRIDNSVTLRGNVAQPGPYAWHEGMRVSDLIPSREFVLTRDYWNRQNHVVAGSSRREFADPGITGDNMRSPGAGSSDFQYGGSDFRDNANRPLGESSVGDGRDGQPRPAGTPSINGPQLEDGTNATLDHQPVRRAEKEAATDIVRNDSEINWRYAVVERLDEHDLSTRLLPFNLGDAIDDNASAANLILKVGDVVTIFSRADIPLPVEEHATFVRVGGEVNAPGVYRVNAGQTLREAVEMAGGLTQHSYLYASQLLRVSTRHIQEEQLKRSTAQMQKELASSFANSAQIGAGTGPDQQTQLKLREAVIAQLSSITPTGRVVLEMKPDANTLADIPDFTLEDGDSFYIPPQLSTVQVSGAVYNENAFRYEHNKLTTAYLEDAGGATREADVKRMFLIRADGTVISRQSRGHHQHASFEKTVLLPGDAIVIPVRLNAGNGWKQLEEITAILSQGALTAASLAVIQK
jgi:polysaccharide export outer membrane protein